MESITKAKLTPEQINRMVKQAFGATEEPEVINELTDGYYNTAYMLRLNSGLKTVLKVSPPQNIKVMRYEKNIMETEVYVLNKILSLIDIPIPKVLYYDRNKKIIENEFFFMEFVEGVPLNKIRSKLSEEHYKEISSELGSFVKQINSIQGSYFGYVSQTDKRHSNWAEAFLSMIKELLDDAFDVSVLLPYSYKEIYNLVYEKSEILKLVKTSSLVHKDIWEGNIFVDPKTSKITGILDCERAIYGDKLLDPVCGFLLENKTFMKSYMGRATLQRDEEIRVVLYQIYLYLIMVIECSFRQYTDEGSYNWANGKLNETLKKLQSF